MGLLTPSAFEEHFASLSDPRCPHAPNQRYQLMDMLVIAVCAVVCGAEGWEDIEEYGKAQADWFAKLLELPHGIPSHDTFQRVLSRLDPEELTHCFLSWNRALSDMSGGDLISLDGKTLRHSFDRASSQAAMHMVSAWSSANRLVLGWSWLRYQPDSALTVWFRERFGGGGKRLRRIGIVAVARKLLIARWRFLKSGVIPEGAVFKEV